jgi:uncharacterized YccA/Bax inhibitor family protein
VGRDRHQAVGATVAVVRRHARPLRAAHHHVTDRFRRIVIGATFGIVILYGVSFLFSLFGHTPSFLYDASLFGIGLSVLVAGVAYASTSPSTST